MWRTDEKNQTISSWHLTKKEEGTRSFGRQRRLKAAATTFLSSNPERRSERYFECARHVAIQQSGLIATKQLRDALEWQTGTKCPLVSFFIERRLVVLIILLIDTRPPDEDHNTGVCVFWRENNWEFRLVSLVFLSPLTSCRGNSFLKFIIFI